MRESRTTESVTRGLEKIKGLLGGVAIMSKVLKTHVAFLLCILNFAVWLFGSIYSNGSLKTRPKTKYSDDL